MLKIGGIFRRDAQTICDTAAALEMPICIFVWKLFVFLLSCVNIITLSWDGKELLPFFSGEIFWYYSILSLPHFLCLSSITWRWETDSGPCCNYYTTTQLTKMRSNKIITQKTSITFKFAIININMLGEHKVVIIFSY